MVPGKMGSRMITFGNVVACLANRHVVTPFKIDADARVSSVAGLSASAGELPDGTVRVGRVSEFNGLDAAARMGCFVLVTDEPRETIAPSPGASIACVPDTDDIEGVAGQLEALLERAVKPAQRDRLIALLLTDNDLSALAVGVSTMLGNPVLVVDSSYNLVAHSNNRGVDDSVWKSSVEHGCLSLDFVERFAGEGSRGFETDAARPELLVASDQGGRALVRKLVFRDERLGYLVVFERMSKFESYGPETYALCASVLAKQLSMEGGRAGMLRVQRSREIDLLLDLMADRVRNELVFRELVAATAFRDPHDYRVVCFDLRFERHPDAPEQERLRLDIEAALPGSYTLVLEDRIVVLLCKAPEDERPVDLDDRLRALSDRVGMRAGMSDRFQNLYELKWRAEEALKAIQLAELMCRQDAPARYEDFRVTHLLSLVAPDQIERFAHPGVLKLAADDEIAGDELFETLDTYLKHGCSVTDTARVCYIHRNTVSYRIGQIESKYRLDLSDPDERSAYMVSCLIVNYLRALRAPCPNPYRPGSGS